jgi:nitroreductase
MVFKLIQKRRSIRQYKIRPVENGKINILVETLLRSPSSRGQNPWKFVIVTDKKLLTHLARSKHHGSAFLKNAPLGIVVCGNPKKSDVWIEDCAVASVFVQMVAESLKLGSCWIQIRKRKHSDSRTAESYIREALDLPHYLKVASIIAIGYPGEKKIPHPKASLDFSCVSYDYYNRNRYE